MSDTVVEKGPSERLEELEGKLATLEEAAWEMLSAVEAQDADEIAKAKRNLGLVFLDL